MPFWLIVNELDGRYEWKGIYCGLPENEELTL